MAKRVLIVDDDQPMREFLMERMELAGFSTTSAGDAMRAAIQAQARRQIPSDSRIRLMGKPPDWGAPAETANYLTVKRMEEKR